MGTAGSGEAARGSQPAPPATDTSVKDYVTGLATRGVLESWLADLLANEAPLALVIVDVVALKATNAQRGFLAGDAILRAAADRLRATVPGATLVARLGGDEMVAVFVGSDAGTAAAAAAGSLADAAARPALRAASLEPTRGETAGPFVDRLYASLRRS